LIKISIGFAKVSSLPAFPTNLKSEKEFKKPEELGLDVLANFV